jgi:hypothetical protein
MGIPQMSALGGGKGFKRPYVEEINARTPYLPQLYGIKRQEASRKQQLGLNQRRFAQERERLGLERDRLAQEKTFGLARQDLAEQTAHEARKRNRYAQNLGLANIGLAGGFGAYDALGQPSISGIGDWFSPTDFSTGFDVADTSDWFGSMPVSAAGGGAEDLFGGDSGLFDYSDVLEGWEGIF